MSSVIRSLEIQKSSKRPRLVKFERYVILVSARDISLERKKASFRYHWGQKDKGTLQFQRELPGLPEKSETVTMSWKDEGFDLSSLCDQNRWNPINLPLRGLLNLLSLGTCDFLPYLISTEFGTYSPTPKHYRLAPGSCSGIRFPISCLIPVYGFHGASRRMEPYYQNFP